MEDYDEIKSQGSGRSRSGSGSPLSGSPSNGRITVTVASMPMLPAPPTPAQNSLTLALPIQPYNKSGGGGVGGGGGGGGGGREDCWSEGATAVLIDAWGERYLELSRGNLKQMHWKEVADVVNSRDDFNKTPKTDIQCKNRIDTVKKKYKSEKAKIVSGGAPSKWLFYDRLDHLIGPTAAKTLTTTAGPSSSSRLPVAIPVSLRSGGSESRFHIQKHQPPKSKTGKNQSNSKKPQFRRSLIESDEEDDELEEELADSDDSLPPEKKPRVIRTEVGGASKEKKRGSGNSLKLLTQAILKFGDAYEAAESAKLQQVMEMEKQKMKFAKDMELQRTQLLMKTQLEISQIKHGRRGGNNNTSNNHHSNNNNNNHSDSN